jgi:hypothetical protein
MANNANVPVGPFLLLILTFALTCVLFAQEMPPQTTYARQVETITRKSTSRRRPVLHPTSLRFFTHNTQLGFDSGCDRAIYVRAH